MQKKYLLIIIIIYFLVALFIFIHFTLSSGNVVKYNVTKPITSTQGIYNLSIDEEIQQNIHAVENGFFNTPSYQSLNITNIAGVRNISIGNIKGSVPECYPADPSLSVKCTPLSSIYSKIKNNVNKLQVAFSSPDDIMSNYYVAKNGSTYYFINVNFLKTISNTGFPIYYISK